MQPEDLGRIDVRQTLLDSSLEILNSDTSQTIVILAVWIVIFVNSFSQQVRIQTFFKSTHQAYPVPVIRHSSSIVYLSDHVPDRIPIDLLFLIW